MCGIAGRVDWRGMERDGGVADVVRCIRHRGPDDEGLWTSPEGLCTLGHARLSIIDLSPAGHQPMLDPETGNAIVFNGEIYNFQALRAECERQGDRFRSHSDTEVILALYRRHGRACVHRLRGMFAIALWDAGRRELFLARDRVGKKPLHYALTPSGIVFASELDALRRHPAVSTETDPEALELYLQLQYVPAPWTIYRGVRKLPPASWAVLGRDGLKIEPYWDVDYRPKLAIGEEEALEGLEEKLREAVRLRMIADVPVGALLSGGVDSSLVVALMAGMSAEPVRTFSIGFEEQAFDELPYAAMVAERYRTAHHPEVVRGEVEPLLLELIRHYGEPYADSSAVPSFRVSRVARQHVKVVMNGDGGDELLGGYPRYWLRPASIRAASVLGRMASPAALARAVPELSEGTSIPARVRRRWLLRAAHPELQSVVMYDGFWGDWKRGPLLGRGRGGSPLLEAWRAGWLERAREHADNPIDRMLWIDNRTYLPDDLLVKMDIATMHCGLEARAPLLDHEVIEFCASLPVQLKVKGGTGKYLLKKLGEKYLPRELLYRPKMGFGIPLGDWLRGPLNPLLRETLLSRGAMEPLDARVIRDTVAEFERGAGHHESRLWALLMYGLWRRACAGAAA
ncbi:MAG TPA: asparagine synthase (glutamine-hydrolyzing) [Longimicrobiaceae bacterium]|nr:asparagine synthase (glutamine-hydrolyzing) [Longimicrobiaceae bacterium]